MALDSLGHLTLDGKQLHAAADSAIRSLGNSCQAAPRDLVVGLVVDDLTGGKTGMAIEDLGGSRVAVHGPVKHSVGGNKRDDAGADPLPKRYPTYFDTKSCYGLSDKKVLILILIGNHFW